MNYLLNIHTTAETAMVNICDGAKVLSTLTNTEAKQHASFLHSAIHQMLQDNNIQINELKAIGVTGGPGSYTGIRVGLSTAKGLCYALKIPLLLFNTLEVMALSAIGQIDNKNALYCPMIDARRREVFTAVYNHELNEIKPPSSMILDENSFHELSLEYPAYFFGSGSGKYKDIIKEASGKSFLEIGITSEALCRFSRNKFKKREFEDIANARPLYIKEFYLGGN